MKQIYNIASIILTTLSYGSVYSYNILLVDDVPSPSHRIWNYAIVRALLERGHNVTLLGLKASNVIVHDNYTMYELGDVAEGVKNMLDINTIHQCGVLENIRLKYEYEGFTCSNNLKSSALKAILNYPSDFFDLLIFDLSFNCLLPLIKKFNYPTTIGVTAFLLPKYLSEVFGNTVNPSYEPFMFSKFSSKMNVFQRVQNYFYMQIDMYTWNRVYTPEWNRMASDAFGNNMAPLDDLLNHISLLLFNNVVGFQYPRLLPPNIIPIGGIHIAPPKELPQDIQEIVDNSRHGIIIFSLGSNLKAEDIDPSKIRSILEVFSKLNETVLWKFGTSLKDLPRNVILRKWLPQRDLLANNKTKLFISHCGGLSTLEAAHSGMPILAIPIMVDQYQYAEQIKNQKWGKVLNFENITAENFYETIFQLLHNTEYRKNAQTLSRIVRDQTDSSKERTIFWIEYAVKHKSTHFLSPESKNLSVFIKSSMDIYLFLFALLLVFVILVKILIFTLKSFIDSYIKRKVKVK